MKKRISKTDVMRRRVKETIRRREAQGWKFDESVKKNVETKGYQYLKSLHDNKYKALNEKATTIDEVTGETITGQQATIRRRWSIESRVKQYNRSILNKMRSNPEFQKAFNEGSILEEAIERLINKFYEYNDPHVGPLENAVKNAKESLGVEGYRVALAKHGAEILDDISLALKYRHGLSFHDDAVDELIHFIETASFTETDKYKYATDTTGFGDVYDEYTTTSFDDLEALAGEYQRVFYEENENGGIPNASDVVKRRRAMTGNNNRVTRGSGQLGYV